MGVLYFDRYKKTYERLKLGIANLAKEVSVISTKDAGSYCEFCCELTNI